MHSVSVYLLLALWDRVQEVALISRRAHTMPSPQLSELFASLLYLHRILYCLVDNPRMVDDYGDICAAFWHLSSHGKIIVQKDSYDIERVL